MLARRGHAASSLGHINLAQGKFKEAIQPFQAAARVRPEDYQALVFRGAAYTGLGHKAEAAAAYARTIEVAKQQLAVNPVMCAHSTWKLLPGREPAIERKLSHGPQKRWRWIRRIPRFFITWAVF